VLAGVYLVATVRAERMALLGSAMPPGGCSVPTRASCVDLARLKQAEGALADVGELVGDDWVQAGLVERELDESALGGLEV
jgi:hypothetical protein